VEHIRGVTNVDAVFHFLLKDRKLIREMGKKDVPGKPMQYGTTKDFLKLFRLNSIADLPKLEESEAERFELEGE
jgi:segregation and condensation protein B